MPFELKDKHLKRYPHFDQLVSQQELLELVESPDRVRSHSFWPFLEYTKTNRRFRHPDHPPPKTRTIRYAARSDAGIFIYYRHLLSDRYEQRLTSLGIADVPTAYRNIRSDAGRTAGKCNIDFARDAFNEVRRHEKCVVATLDISSYFDCIDHARLRRVWAELLGSDNLPPDHYRVFKAITAYTSVQCDELYQRLDYMVPETTPQGIQRMRFTMAPNELPKKLCSNADFRRKVAGDSGEFSRLISEPNNEYGIPQGAPLSDLLANAYLLEFDQAMASYVSHRGGRVWRYSDDIIIVLPGGKDEGKAAIDFAISEISRQGRQLRIKPEKTALGQYQQMPDGGLQYKWLDGNQGKNGLEYLGFRFDGKRVFLRDTTLSNFQRKITRYAKRTAYEYVRRFEGKSVDWMTDQFKKKSNEFEKRYGRVVDFEPTSAKKNWTFWTYAERAQRTFSDFDCRVLPQIRGYRDKVNYAFEKSAGLQMSGNLSGRAFRSTKPLPSAN